MFGMRRSYNRRSYNGIFGLVSMLLLLVVFIVSVPLIVYALAVAALYVIKVIAEHMSSGAADATQNMLDNAEAEEINDGQQIVDNFRSQFDRNKKVKVTEDEKYAAHMVAYLNKMRAKYPHADAELFTEHIDELATCPVSMLKSYEEVLEESHNANIKAMNKCAPYRYTIEDMNEGDIVKTIKQYPLVMHVVKMPAKDFMLVVKNVDENTAEVYQSSDWMKLQTQIERITTATKNTEQVGVSNII